MRCCNCLCPRAEAERNAADALRNALPRDNGYSVRVESFEVAARGRRIVYFTLLVRRGTAQWPIRRRYRQIAALHRQLTQGAGRSPRLSLPKLPPRITFRSLLLGPRDGKFLASRAARLQRYFDSLLRMPALDECDSLVEFLCSVDITNMSYDALLDLEEAMGRATPTISTVDAAAISALPRRVVQPEPSTKSSASSDCERCVICQEAPGDKDDVRVLPCGHEYHFACIQKWVKESNTCCICHATAVYPTPLETPCK
eukprot:TRINITY_DN16969_c0_g1_i2.p1 TRINITY_DN16969_c0_g1~~TRINITY_DN16969_c0_g1_i2.p1  ORF type:complete len:257 (+),score=27.67 TRINITY_DN16969_c0_g1_i2:421-1191(+)